MKRKGIVALLLAIILLGTSVGAVDWFNVAIASENTYKLDTEYDATEQYLKVQPLEYTYNGHKMHPFYGSSTWLSDELEIGEKYSLFTYGELVEGEKFVLEFKTPIDSKKFENITIMMKNIPGNEFYAYNASDNALVAVRKEFAFSSYEMEPLALPLSSFADENGMVAAIVFECVTVTQKGQLFVDGFSLGKEKYQLNTWYDATKEYIKLQSGYYYKGVPIFPFAENSTFWSEEAKVESDEGYCFIANSPTGKQIGKGDAVVIEFNHAIDSGKFPYLNISMVTSTPATASFEFCNVNEIKDGKLGKTKQTGSAGSWNFMVTSLKTSDFADKEGYVTAIALRCTSEEAATLSIGGFSLTSKESSIIGEEVKVKPYQYGVFYDASEEYLKTQGMTEYKGVAVAPFTERTKFWSQEAKVDSDDGYGLIAHRMDAKPLQKGDVMILELVAPIKASKFEVMNLTLATATTSGATFEVYSVEEIKNETLGPIRGRISADFWTFKTNSIALASLANKEGYVEAVALKLVTDGADTFTVGGFSLAPMDSLVEKDGPDILDDKIQVEETDDAYNFYIEFNKAGSASSSADEKSMGDQILINGVPISEINKTGNYVTAKWQQMGRYYLYVSVDKDYKGKGSVINKDKLLVGNCIGLKKGLEIPNGEKLSGNYNLHIYLTSNVTDIESETEYNPIVVNKIFSRIDQNEDLMISVTFNNHITGSTIYYGCNPDAFNRKDLAVLNNSTTTYYDPNVANAFISGGYKSSILDNLLINGSTIAEWLAKDKLAESSAFNTAVMVHYGMEGSKVMTIVITKLSTIGQQLKEKHESNDLNLTFKEGLKFSTGRECKSTSSYQYVDGVWSLLPEGDFAVYYDGEKVEDGETISCEKAANVSNISVVGQGIYTIKEDVSGTSATYSIYEEEKKLVEFTVNGTEPAVVTVYNKKTDITTYLLLGGAALLLVVLATLVIVIRRRKHGQKKDS